MKLLTIAGPAVLLSSLAHDFTAVDRPAREPSPARDPMPARKHLVLWAPDGGGRAERARRRRQIQAGTLGVPGGLIASMHEDCP